MPEYGRRIVSFSSKYTATIYNLGHSILSVDVLVGNLPFMSSNNQVNSLSGAIIAVILSIIVIIVLIAGVIVLVIDRRRNRPKAPTRT